MHTMIGSPDEWYKGPVRIEVDYLQWYGPGVVQDVSIHGYKVPLSAWHCGSSLRRPIKVGSEYLCTCVYCDYQPTTVIWEIDLNFPKMERDGAAIRKQFNLKKWCNRLIVKYYLHRQFKLHVEAARMQYYLNWWTIYENLYK